MSGKCFVIYGLVHRTNQWGGNNSIMKRFKGYLGCIRTRSHMLWYDLISHTTPDNKIAIAIVTLNLIHAHYYKY